MNTFWLALVLVVAVLLWACWFVVDWFLERVEDEYRQQQETGVRWRHR